MGRRGSTILAEYVLRVSSCISRVCFSPEWLGVAAVQLIDWKDGFTPVKGFVTNSHWIEPGENTYMREDIAHKVLRQVTCFVALFEFEPCCITHLHHSLYTVMEDGTRAASAACMLSPSK